MTIRLLDPPLHEFLPHTPEEQAELSKKIGVSAEVIARRVQELHEFNPMLGHRGCRLGIVYPEITRMQARAIFEAACDVKKAGIEVLPEVMIPLAGFSTEFRDQEKIVRETAEKVFLEKHVEYLVGTMIELPRAAVCADQIAKDAEFFSFGTNDLTQTTLGMSRDDYGSFINDYREKDIIANDPFQTIDRDGVGALMKIAVAAGRVARPDIKLGICGEHGGDPGQRHVLPRDRPELRQLLAVSRAHRPPGRRPSRVKEKKGGGAPPVGGGGGGGGGGGRVSFPARVGVKRRRALHIPLF